MTLYSPESTLNPRNQVTAEYKSLWNKLFFVGSLLAAMAQGWMLGTIHALSDRTEWRTPAIERAIGDAGVLCASTDVRFLVEDTQKLSAIFHGHVGALESGRIALGDKLSARVDAGRRQSGCQDGPCWRL